MQRPTAIEPERMHKGRLEPDKPERSFIEIQNPMETNLAMPV